MNTQLIRWAPQHFNKMETNLPKNNNNNYEIKVKHTNSKYCRFVSDMKSLN